MPQKWWLWSEWGSIPAPYSNRKRTRGGVPRILPQKWFIHCVWNYSYWRMLVTDQRCLERKQLWRKMHKLQAMWGVVVENDSQNFRNHAKSTPINLIQTLILFSSSLRDGVDLALVDKRYDKPWCTLTYKDISYSYFLFHAQ